MKKIFAIALAVAAGSAHGQLFFQASDGTVNFTKAAFADETNPSNWDQISSSVAITRGDTRGIYNPVQEPAFQGGGSGSPSPVGTRWVFGATVQDVINGTVTLSDFGTWIDANSGQPPATVGVDAVVYLEAEEAFVDIRFTDWGVRGFSGGSFSYTRAIVDIPEPCLADVNQDGAVNGLDFGAWLSAFNANDPRADQNQDGMINGLDFGAWLSNFNAGCD